VGWPRSSRRTGALVDAAGVPGESIITERKSVRTRGSVIEVVKLLKMHGWQSAVIVTSELDVPRVRAAFRKLGFENLSFQQVPEFGTPSNSYITRQAGKRSTMRPMNTPASSCTSGGDGSDGESTAR